MREVQMDCRLTRMGDGVAVDLQLHSLF